MAGESKETKKVQCPECEKDVTLTQDEDGDWQGRCPACKLDVGRVITRRRLDRALRKMEEGEQAESAKGKKGKSDWF